MWSKPTFDNTEVAETRRFTWEIRDWSALGEREVSPPFTCGGFRWQLLLFPRGNPQANRKGMISLYLNAIGPEEPQTTWHCCCAFSMAMWNPQHPDSAVSQASQHRFTPRITDWGYGEFQAIRSAFVRAPSAPAPLIAADPASGRLAVNIGVDMDVLEDPTGVLWHDFHDYDSREQTGYTGLVNQGATCYLNSLLQSLYFTKAFRTAVYALPDSTGVTGGLQRVFYRLATSAPAVDTTDLTRSFGWDSADAFTQHDVQELARVLMDRLESKMKNTALDGFLSKLFVGQMRSYIKCINVPFESGRSEDFWDVQLNVRGMRDVYASFEDYCSEETLMGENQYAAGEFGLQDAVKGVIFESLPPVLHLQLKRYDFDWMREIQVKINDRYEYPLELDLSPYVSDKSRKWQFELHGVLVHSGDLDSGHYYALIKPEAAGPNAGPEELARGWYKFDDDRVTKASVHEVLEENFGGDERSLLKRVTSAYMLVYVRRDASEFVLPKENSSAVEEVPKELAARLEEEERAEEKRQQELVEKQQNVILRRLDETQMRAHTGAGLFASADGSGGSEKAQAQADTVRVRVGTSVAALIEQFGAQSLWIAANEDGAGMRACPRRLQPVPAPQEYQVEQIQNWTNTPCPTVFFGPEVGTQQRLVFVKQFVDGKAAFIKTMLVSAGGILSSEFNDLYALYDHTQLSVEVTTPNYIRGISKGTLLAPLKSDTVTVADAGIENGEIIVVSRRGDPVEAYFSELHSRITLVLSKYKGSDIGNGNIDGDVGVGVGVGVQNSAAGEKANCNNSDEMADETPVGAAAADSKPDEVVVSINDSYETVATQIAARLKCDPAKLQLQSLPPHWYSPSVIKSSGVNISDLWSFSEEGTVEVLYRVLPVPLPEFEQLSEVTVIWFPKGHTAESTQRIALGKPEEHLTLKGVDPKEMMIWVAQSGRKCKELLNPTLGALSRYEDDGWDVYAAPMVPLEREARSVSGSRLCACFHFQGEPNRAHGVPFYFAVVPNEKFLDTKARIFQHLRHSKTPDRSLEKIRFAIVNDRSFDTTYLSDDDNVVLADVLPHTAYLGLDHPDRVRNNPYQQAIHID